MEYTFKIRKNIFMYNHLLIVSNGQKNYEAIVEDAPREEKTILIWLDDFGFPKDEVGIIKDNMVKWFASQNIGCVFNEGKGR